MTKKQKKTLKRIIISAVLYLAIILASKLVAIPWYLELVLFLVPYFIIGHDVLRKAVLGIVHGEVFDENFLMAVATVGALCLGEFSESVAVMLFLPDWRTVPELRRRQKPQEHQRFDGYPPRQRQPGNCRRHGKYR